MPGPALYVIGAVHHTTAALLDGGDPPDATHLAEALGAADLLDHNRLATEVAELIGPRPDLAEPLTVLLRRLLAAALT